MPDSSPAFAIRSRGNSLVLDPVDWRSIATFPTRKAARAYADSILPQMPSKDTPLRVVVYTETDKIERKRVVELEESRRVQRRSAQSMADQGHTVICQGRVYSPDGDRPERSGDWLDYEEIH